MSGLNQCVFGGNLGADPELVITPNGGEILKLRLAVNESWVTADGEKKERVEWVRGTMFGKPGSKRTSALAKNLSKGQYLTIVGSQRTTEYEKDGQKRYMTETIIRDVVFGGGSGKKDGGGAANEPTGEENDFPDMS